MIQDVQQDLYDLPGDWRWERLADICDPINGRGFKKTEWRDSGLPIIRIQNLKDPDAAFNYFDGDLDNKHRVESGDLLFAWSGTPGTSFGAHIWRGESAALNQHIFNVKFDAEDIDPKYFCYALNQNVTRYIQQAQGGVGLAHITKRKFLESSIPVAPRDQQDRIVAEIEKQFSRLDEAVASLKRVKANLKRYKASVLKAAVGGKLTEEWRKQNPDVEPASRLLERILAERRAKWEEAELAKMRAKGKEPKDDKWKRTFKEPESVLNRTLRELPSGWAWSRMKDVGNIQLGRQRSPKYHSGPNMKPYLRVKNVFEDRINTSDIMEMDFPPSDFMKYKLGYGDILLNEGQSPEFLGRPAIYRNEVPDGCFTNTLIRFRPDSPLGSDYPLLVFRAYMRSGRFRKEGTITTNIAHLSAARFAEIEFPVPPEQEQLAIVEISSRILSQIDSQMSLVDTAFRRIKSLRQSIMAACFSKGI